MRSELKFDAQTIIEIIGEFTLGKSLGDSLPQFDVRTLFGQKKNNGVNYLFKKSKSDKLLLLRPISRLYEIPEFEGDGTSKLFTDAFYDVVIKLTKDLTLNDNQFKYYRNNLTSEEIDNKDQLIGYLIHEKLNPARHDSRYLLGFRSVWYILKNNLDNIDGYYISDINSRLKPFFNAYRHKAILIPGICL